MKYTHNGGVAQGLSRTSIIGLAVAFALTLVLSVFSFANARGNSDNRANSNADKVTICHYSEDEDVFFPISVSSRSQEKHVENHGDFLAGQPGDAYGEDGEFYVDTCETSDRFAEITSPDADSVYTVGDEVSFEAYLIDKDNDDSVQWAVREGTCAAGTNTVFGNVDTFSDGYAWVEVSDTRSEFTALADTSGWAAGDYCFVFNPTETSGDVPIRETREFSLRADVSGNWLLDFANGTENRQFVNLVQDEDGNVEGEFLYLSGSTWLNGGTLEGDVSGDVLSLYYERPAPLTYTGDFTGTVDGDTIVDGNFTDSNGGVYSWTAVR